MHVISRNIDLMSSVKAIAPNQVRWYVFDAIALRSTQGAAYEVLAQVQYWTSLWMARK